MDVSDKNRCVAMVKRVASANDGNVTEYPCSCELCRLLWLQIKGTIAEKKDWDETFSVNIFSYSNISQNHYLLSLHISVCIAMS